MSKRKISLANKYRPATFSDMSEQASIKTILENQIKNNKLKGAYLFTGSAGVGKAQPLNADIMTINGYKKMKDIQLNDILIDGLGNSCKVIGIYPQGIKPIYKITFSDRTSTLCSDEHIWKVGHYVNYKREVKWENLTIKELLNINLKKGNNTKGWKYRIPTPIINCWSDSNLKIDPYLLGCLLGDGCLTEHTINISNPEEDIINKLNKLAEDINYKLSLVNQSKKNRCPMYNFVKQENCNFGLRDYIKSLNLNKSCLEKHIPKEYLYTTVENRIKLLQGLFDTDGWVSNRNDNRSVLIFNTSSPQLSKDFAFLVRSLGGTDTVVRKEAKYCLKGSKEYKRCNDTYQHIIKFSNDILPFSSEKHKAKYKSPQNKAMRRIVNIEYIGEQECQCIKVDSIDETYMTNDLIVTHNTTSARIIAGMMNEHKGRPIEMDCASHNGIEDMRKIIDDCRSRPIGTKYKIFILDECVTGDTKVLTKNGYINIKDINIGDNVATSMGWKPVINKIVKKISSNRCLDVKLTNNNIIHTTVDHLFMTTNGWIKAQELVRGDELIVYNKLFELWQRDTYKQEGEKILQQSLLQYKNEETKRKENERNVYKEMCDLWATFCSKTCQQKYKNLFKDLQGKINIAIREDNNEFRIWNGIKETIITKNVQTQPFSQSFNYSENDTYERIKWDATSTYKGQKWKWNLYKTSNDIIQQFRQFLDIGVCNSNSNQEKQQPSQISYFVQSRPWLSFENDSDRGGWQIAQYEKWYTKRYKEANEVGRVRVESVTFHKSRDNEQFGSSTNTYSEMYDLEIKDSSNYFAEGVLIHNCHMLTIQSWNGLLKLLEEPPEYVILLLCTTNPEKIPGTILSRVQRFNLARISTQGIINRLKHIIDSENKDFMQAQDLSESEIQLRNQLIQENKPYIQYEDSAISYIARLAKGGMRDSITNLEKCLDYSRDLTLDNVHTILSGGVNEQTLLEFLKYTLNKDSKGCLLHFNNIYMSGVDTLLFLKLYIEFLENCIKYIITQDANIVTLADDTLSWVFQNRNFIQEMRYQLLDALKIRNDYSSEDLKIVIESWIIQICNS